MSKIFYRISNNQKLSLLYSNNAIWNIENFGQELFDSRTNSWRTNHEKIKIYKTPIKLRFAKINPQGVESWGTYSDKLRLIFQRFGTCCTIIIIFRACEFITIYITAMQCFQQKRQRWRQLRKIRKLPPISQSGHVQKTHWKWCVNWKCPYREIK